MSATIQSKPGNSAAIIAISASATVFLVIGGVLYYNVKSTNSEYEKLLSDIRDTNQPLGSYKDLDNISSPLNKDYFKKHPERVTISPTVAKKIAIDLHTAKGVFNDNENAITNAFRQLKTKEDVSRVSSAFSGIYNKDLYTHLDSILNDSEMDVMINKKIIELK